MSKGIFITGTGTDVGKTYITALIIKQLVNSGLKAGYYKAALSGAEVKNGVCVPGDAEYVLKTAGIKINPCDFVSYTFKTPVSPHLAAQIENTNISTSKIKNDFNRIKNSYDFVTVEGSGGIICPISIGDESIMLTDIICNLDLGVIIVADAGLGTINSTILTVEHALNNEISVKAIILNKYDESDFMHIDNKKMIELMSGVKVFTCSQNGTDIDISTTELISLYKDV